MVCILAIERKARRFQKELNKDIVLKMIKKTVFMLIVEIVMQMEKATMGRI